MTSASDYTRIFFEAGGRCELNRSRNRRAMLNMIEARIRDPESVRGLLTAFGGYPVLERYLRKKILRRALDPQVTMGLYFPGAVNWGAVLAGLAAVSYIQTRARGEVEGKNRELAASNLELEAERERTAEARDLAEVNRERAVESEQVALANEQEALWQSYVGNVGAAYAALEVGSASEARRASASMGSVARRSSPREPRASVSATKHSSGVE